MFTSFHKRAPSFTTSQTPSQLAAATAAAVATEIILSDVIINITIIGMKTKAALKAANEHMSAAATLVVMRYDLTMCCHMRNEPLRQLNNN
jgi:hypothetical protein